MLQLLSEYPGDLDAYPIKGIHFKTILENKSKIARCYGWEEGVVPKRKRKFVGIMELFYISIAVVVTQNYTYVKSYRTVHQRKSQFDYMLI